MDGLKVPSGPLIVIVDDHEPLLRAMSFALETEGYRVRAYVDGDSLLREGNFSPVDCFVIDYKLPDRDGIRLMQELRQQGASGAMILITTAPSERLVAEALGAGAPIVEKPLHGDALSRCIAAQLHVA